MQLKITHKIENELVLPINYHHILQSIIYAGMESGEGLGDFFHDCGFAGQNRTFKLFVFGLLKGKYRIQGSNIVFYDKVSFEVRSPEIMLLQVLAENMQKKGIWYGRQHFSQIRVQMTDKTVEEEEILIRMNSPICAYQTDSLTGRTYFCHPEDDTFEELINVNFRHKYEACYGVKPAGEIGIIPVHLGSRDKYVTKYKNFYITAWKGDYLLVGERKYLDFLYQTGVGSKNSQGFGMFDIKRTEGEGDAERRR